MRVGAWSVAVSRMRTLGQAAAIALALAQIGSSAADARRPDPLPPTKLPPLLPAEIDDTLAIGGQNIDAKKVRTRMTVAVGLNGRGPYRFVVDSGADTSVIGARAAALLAMPAGKPVLLTGVTDRGYVQRVRVEELRLGSNSFNNLHLPVLKESDLGGDGMIGIDALAGQRLMMDFEKRTITVEDAQRPQPRFDGEIVVIARARRGQLILTKIEANRKPVEAVVDTGSEVTIGNLLLREKLFGRRRDLLSKIEVIGVTGVTVSLEIGLLSELKLGPVILRDIPIAFADVPPFGVFGLADKPSLLLGTDLMESFRRVSLDFRARKVRFQLRRCKATTLSITTASSGITSRLMTSRDGEAACRR